MVKNTLTALGFATATVYLGAKYGPALLRQANPSLFATGTIVANFVGGHTDRVNAVAWSSNGKYVASASEDNTMCIWEVATGKGLQTINGAHAIKSISWSPDSKHIVLCNGYQANNSFQVWDPLNVVILFEGNASISPEGLAYYSAVEVVSWSPDGSYIALASANRLIILDIRTKTVQSTHNLYDDIVSIAWSPDGSHVATYSEWSVECYQVSSTVVSHSNTASMQSSSLSWFPNSRVLVYPSKDGVMSLDVYSNTKTTLYTDQVYPVLLAPNGLHAAEIHSDRSIVIREMRTGNVVARTTGIPTVYAWSPDSRYIIAGGYSDGRTDNPKAVYIWSPF